MTAGEKAGEQASPRRCFVAVSLSVETTRRIAETIEELRKPAEKNGLRVAWVPPANLHVTLKFLGWVREETTDAVRDAVRAIAAAQAPLDVQAIGAGAFPNASHARVLWVGLKGAEPLSVLARLIDDRLAELGFEKELRAFHPHVTIGRVKEGGRAGNAEGLLAPLQNKDFGASRLREVVLYESRLLRAGAEYSPLARLPLGGPEAAQAQGGTDARGSQRAGRPERSPRGE